MPSTAALAFSLLQQAAFLSFAVVILSALSNQLTPRPRLRRVALGAIFGFVGSLTMVPAVTIGPGYILDVRIAAMALSAAFGGPVALLVSAIIIMAVRAYIGGATLYVGLLATAVGGAWLLVFLAILKRVAGDFTKRQLLALAAASIVPYMLGPLGLSYDPGSSFKPVPKDLAQYVIDAATTTGHWNGEGHCVYTRQ